MRGREVAIRRVEGQRKEGEIVRPTKFAGHVVAVDEQTTSRRRVLLREPRVEIVDVDRQSKGDIANILDQVLALELVVKLGEISGIRIHRDERRRRNRIALLVRILVL